ncbi:MAG TPA: DUF1587 domain-containing protein, partial [Candidatus Solibacter sp.]|nr:DUF1587 domain-containing protein [Candidatus Solibacter sp.]
MSLRTRLAALTLLCAAVKGPAADTDADLQRQYAQTVQPFLKTYCIGCHGGTKPMAQLDLGAYPDPAAVMKDDAHWALVMARLSAKDMPPRAATQPPTELRQQVIDWIDSARRNEARKSAGDPGVVLARRLSNAEYNYTIRDLTGVDLRPAKEFPVDPANPAGFDNSGESLAMSPALLNKYLQAAREVANHMVLKPDGIAFAPHLALAETDRDQYCIEQIIDFYRQQNTDYADYFQAAWQYKNSKPKSTLAAIAAQNKVSPKYVVTVWHALEEQKEDVGPGAKLQAMWRTLPASGNVRSGVEAMRDYVVALRKKTEMRFPDLAVNGVSRTSQPFLMWRNRQYATHRTSFDPTLLQVEGEWKPPEPEAPPKKPMS